MKLNSLFSGEVVLIVFIVLLAIMVLVVVAKYYHLQKNIGNELIFKSKTSSFWKSWKLLSRAETFERTKLIWNDSAVNIFFQMGLMVELKWWVFNKLVTYLNFSKSRELKCLKKGLSPFIELMLFSLLFQTSRFPA